MATMIRDALEAILLAGVKAWGLQISTDAVSDGVRFLDDDGELLTVAECLNVPGNVISNLTSLLEQHPGILDSQESHQAFRDASQGQVEGMVKELSEVLGMFKVTLRHEVDPDYLSNILGTLVYLGMEKFCPEVRQASRSPGLPDETAGYSLRQYADAVVAAGSPEAKKAHLRIMKTELGRLIDHLVRRQARRIFTLLAFGDGQALAMALAQIIEEVKHADYRTDSRGDEVHEEEAR
ncbi:MAG: hypothetical protein V1737_03145 [Chloroflexota bacterium]